MAQKNAPAGTSRPIRPQIGSNGFADIIRQWKLCPPAAFATDPDEAVLPIEVLQIQRNNFSGTQSQTR
jgi:hypothetical protein